MLAAYLDSATAERFANMALACVHREYPTKIAHVLNSEQDVRAPRELTPVFYGCYDWHSSVHGHWMLARLARIFPDAPFAGRAKVALAKSLNRPNLEREAEYVSGEGRASFERPYGLAWLLQLAAELHEWDDPLAKEWSTAVVPLEDVAVQRFEDWLGKLSHPVRSGEHSQSAFSLGLMLDYAQARGRREFEALLQSRIRAFYFGDRGGPLHYEPSGEDFLSPCLAEADAMRRILPKAEFAEWLEHFLPSIPREGSIAWLRPVVVSDPGDGKLAHLDGLNLSRAWMLNGVASGLPVGDARLASLRTSADEHARDGLRAVNGDRYEGAHWLGTFAVYLLTQNL